MENKDRFDKTGDARAGVRLALLGGGLGLIVFIVGLLTRSTYVIVPGLSMLICGTGMGFIFREKGRDTSR